MKMKLIFVAEAFYYQLPGLSLWRCPTILRTWHIVNTIPLTSIQRLLRNFIITLHVDIAFHVDDWLTASLCLFIFENKVW